jgi:hypothetical protein
MTANPALFPLPAHAPARSYPPGTQLNWLVRYVPIKQYLTGPALASLIEVGAGARGLASIIDDSFVGIDVRIDGDPAPGMYPFSYEGGRVPFKSGSFHTVVSMDTLAHVPPPNRIDFLHELLRISASRVIFSFPSQGGGAGGEPFMRSLFQRLGVAPPAGLDGRDDLGLPLARDIEAILNQLDDWSWRPLPTAGDFVHLLAALADIIPDAAPTIRPVLERNAAEVEAWVLAGAFGPANRKVYSIERRAPRAPAVDLNNPATLIKAITCPNCDGQTEIAPPGVRCTGCGGSFAPDERGIFRLHRTAIAARPTAPAGVTFALAPDWSGNEWLIAVHNFLHAFSGADPHRLWITADPRQMSLGAVLQRLRPLLLPFVDLQFAEIFLSETPPDAGTALPLSSDRGRVHDYSSDWFRAQVQAAAAKPNGAKVYW